MSGEAPAWVYGDGATLDRVSDGIVALDEQFRCVYLNEPAAAALPGDPETVPGHTVWGAVPELDGSQTETALREAMAEGGERSVEQYIGGLDRWFRVRIVPQAEGLVVYLTDVTERKDREADLARSNRQLRALVENTSEAVFIKNREGRYELMNEAGAALFGREREEVLGLTDADLFDEESAAAIRDVDAEIMATDRPQTMERARYIEGEKHVFLTNKQPYRDADGNLIGIMGISRDISERQSFEQRLRDLQEAVRQLNAAETADDIASLALEAAVTILGFPVAAVWLFDEERGELVPVAESDEAHEVVGPAPTFGPGGSLAWEVFEAGEYVVAEDVTTHEAVYNPETPLDAELIVPLGERGVMSTSSTETDVFSAADVELFRMLAAAVREGLARAEREAQLRELTEEYEALLENAGDAIFLIEVDWKDGDPTFRYERLSPSHERISGMQTDTVRGQTPREALGETAGADVAANYRRCARAKEPIQYEEVIEMPEGELTWQTSLAPVVVNGQVRRIVGIARDLTERAERERALKRQNERLDEFASVISHDLRNPLNVAQGRLALMADDVESEHLQPVRTALDRMTAIVEDTLTLAREGSEVGETEVVRLTDLAAQSWGMVETGTASLQIADAFEVRADPDRLQHVFENLFRNAVEHAGPGVTVRIERLDDGFAVEDDGPGVPDADREDVFEPGRTAAENGTGFGLTIVKRIAAAHDWTVVLTEGAGGGARFEFHGVTIED